MSPVRVPGCSWQAGVTPGNERLKVMLDGEPVKQAFAACAGREGGGVFHPAPGGGGEGGGLCPPEPEGARVRATPRHPLGLAYLDMDRNDAVIGPTIDKAVQQ